VNTKVTRADVVLTSVRVTRQPGGQGALFLRLTRKGANRFRALTRALAQRGARLGREQQFAVRIGGRVRARPKVDYRASPDGLDGRNGLELLVVEVSVARALAKQIRDA
jgi:hypothetical protein